MLARLGETLRMRAYRMNEHAGHALAVWRPFRTCLERHSRMNVLTEISCGGSIEDWRTGRWSSVCDGMGGKDDGNECAYARGSQKKRLLSEVAAIGRWRYGRAMIGESLVDNSGLLHTCTP
jgi:hypothetical protein